MPQLHHGAMGSWSPLVFTLAIAFTAFVYLRGWSRLRSIFLNAVPAWRAASFLSGLLLVWVAVASPLAALDREMLTVHMIQHLLLMTLAPPLIWLGAPAIPLLNGLPSQSVRWVIASRPRRQFVERLGSMFAQPAFCWLAATAALVLWHIPALFTLGLQSEAWHLLEHASFLGTGLLFWWPVVQPWPSVSRWPELSIILYLFFATLPCDILSGFLVFCDRVVYSVYFTSSQPFGLSPLADQQCAGALMWTCVTVVYLIVGGILTTRFLSPRTYRGHELETAGWDREPQSVPQAMEAL